MEGYSDESPVNIGTGSDMTIEQLACDVAYVVGYEGVIRWDKSKPNGTPRRLLDTTKITKLGWKPKMDLINGLRRTYDDYVNQRLAPHASKIYDNMR
jgi:GDP-L-fucose synthase